VGAVEAILCANTVIQAAIVVRDIIEAAAVQTALDPTVTNAGEQIRIGGERQEAHDVTGILGREVHFDPAGGDDFRVAVDADPDLALHADIAMKTDTAPGGRSAEVEIVIVPVVDAGGDIRIAQRGVDGHIVGTRL